MIAAAFSLIMLFGVPQNVAINAGKPLALCDVLQNLASYSGKIIEIRGDWPGNALEGEDCRVRTGTYVWHSGILLAFPKDLAVENDKPANWSFDTSVWDRSLAILHLLKKQFGGDVRVRATFIGRLDTYGETLQIVTHANGYIVPLGYGHLNAYPARLVLVDVKDVAAGSR
jgi:hypothetical protein